MDRPAVLNRESGAATFFLKTFLLDAGLAQGCKQVMELLPLAGVLIESLEGVPF